MASSQDDDLLTVRELAALFGCHIRTIRRLIARQKLLVIRKSPRRLYVHVGSAYLVAR
jgi:excisionase family DNA binding protein